MQPHKRKVKSDPQAELPIKNFKFLCQTTDLHMANRGIDKIRGFDQFPCLEVLWLQDNQITTLNHLDSNFRLKRLYFSGNKLCTLEGSSLRNLRNLELLFLANNQITDLAVQLRELQQLPFLEQLELLGNPVAEETHYREQIIYRCPSVKVLDRHVITPLDRMIAQQRAREYGWTKQPAETPPSIGAIIDKDGLNVHVKKRGPHSQAGVPRIWRPRVCFNSLYRPPLEKPTRWKSGAYSECERAVGKHASTAERRREAAARALEAATYAGLGPPLVGNYEADGLVREQTTPLQQEFRDDLKQARSEILFQAYPPWNATKALATARGPIRQRMFSPKKPSTPPVGNSNDITLDRGMHNSFERRRAGGFPNSPKQFM